MSIPLFIFRDQDENMTIPWFNIGFWTHNQLWLNVIGQNMWYSTVLGINPSANIAFNIRLGIVHTSNQINSKFQFYAGLMFLPAKINFDRPAVEIGSNWYKLVLTG